MKILITGFNAEQVYRDYFKKKQLQILNSHYSLIRCLEDMGHTVDQRTVSLGEDLSKYDEVIVYLHSIQSFCQRLFEGLYAISARPNAILAFDDWQVDQVFTSFLSYRKDLNEKPDAAFRQYLFDLYQGKSTPEEVKSFKQAYIDACDIVTAKKNRLMVCRFAGGDMNKYNLDWQGKMFGFNPNPYNMNRGPHNNYGIDEQTLFVDYVGSKDKNKSWIFASLIQEKTQKWLKNQSPSWPIKLFGAKRGKYKGERVTEPEMCKIYNSNWGCLMPEYYHAGSGWWRSRVQQVADAESVLLCSDIEGAIYGEAYVGNTIDNIESMDIDQLESLAKAQRECLYDNHPLDKEVQKKEITEILNAAC